MRAGLNVVAVAVVLTAGGCVTPPPPMPETPVVVPPESAARLGVVIQAPEAAKMSGRAMSEITGAMNAIAAGLRQSQFPVTMDPHAPASARVNVRMQYLGTVIVEVEANGTIVDHFTAPSGTPAALHYLGRYAGYRLQRSEALAAIAASLAARPQAGRADQPRPWAKTTATAATRRLAVLEFRGSLAPNLLALLSDQARSAAVEAVRPHGIAVMTRENTAVMLKDQGRAAAACTEGDCEVETARLIGAHLVVTGEVSRVGNAQFLQMKLFDAEAGTLLASKQADATDDLALVKAAKPAAAALFE